MSGWVNYLRISLKRTQGLLPWLSRPRDVIEEEEVPMSNSSQWVQGKRICEKSINSEKVLVDLFLLSSLQTFLTRPRLCLKFGYAIALQKCA